MKEAERQQSTFLIVLPVIVAAVAALVGHLLGLRHHFEILTLHFERTLHVHGSVVGRRALVARERGRVELLVGAGLVPALVAFALALAAGLLLLSGLSLRLRHRQLISVQNLAELHLRGKISLLLVIR